MKEYVIPVYGIKTGIHEYEFDLDRSFFESFDSQELDNPSIKVGLTLEKMSAMLILSFEGSGNCKVPCDRCGAEMTLPINCKDRVIVKYGEVKPEDTDEIIVLLPSEHELDVSERIYEMIMLNLPARMVHESEDGCDQEALKKLSSFKGDEDDPIDPRWEALKKLK